MIDKDRVRKLNEWPRWPYLPLKRATNQGGPELAVIYAEFDGEFPNEKFFFNSDPDINIFTLHPIDGLGWKDRKTLDELEAEGWVVD